MKLHRTAHDREVTEDFWNRLGDPVEKRIEVIATSAQGLLDIVKKTTTKKDLAEISRAAIKAQRTCDAIDQPPPQELTDLLATLLGCEGAPRTQPRRGQLKAARYLAANPGASNRAVGAAVGADPKTVAKWNLDEYFRHLIRCFTRIP